MSSLIKSTFGGLKTKAGLKDAEEFLGSHPVGSGKLAAKQVKFLRWISLGLGSKDSINFIRLSVIRSQIWHDFFPNAMKGRDFF